MLRHTSLSPKSSSFGIAVGEETVRPSQAPILGHWFRHVSLMHWQTPMWLHVHTDVIQSS